LLSVGTRGDIEPFLAIGEILKEKGHQVICAFPEQFRDITEESDLQFFSLGKRFIEMLDSADGKAATGGSGSGLKKFLAYIRLARNQADINKELVYKQYELIENEQPDRIIYNGKAIYPIIWELKHRGRTIFVSPLPYMHYVKGHTHVAFNSNFGTLLNKLTFSLAHFGMVTTVMITRKWLKIKDKINRKQIRNILRNNKSIYTISPSLFPRPGYWNKNLKVLGNHKRDIVIKYQPEKGLIRFLGNHKKILFITFGSMLNPEPKKITRIIVDILERNKIPAIINTASGGLVEPDKYNSALIHFVSGIPYDWIFPKMYAVIHHGGSGTTHMALKYGCVTMIIPHIIDQFLWNRILYDLNVSPDGIRIGKISRNRLEPKMIELMCNDEFKKRTMQLSHQMNQEDFRSELYNALIE
jgi:sterol 3beta-glucosyltransferase